MANAQRIQWIDNAKGLILIFVILFHAKVPWHIIAYISSWFMPCFFFISGLLFRMQADANLWGTIKHRIHTLLIPYFALSFLFILLNPNNYQGDISHRFMSNIWDTIMGNSGFMTVSLWFVYVLFEVNCATAILHKMVLKMPMAARNGILGLTVVGCIVGDTFLHNYSLPFKLSDFFILWFMYLIGYIYRDRIIQEKEVSSRNIAFITIICLGLSLAAYSLSGAHNLFISESLRLLLLLSSTFMLAGVVWIGARIIPQNFIGTSLRYLASNAMCILAVHMWVICLCLQYIGTYSPYLTATLGLSVSLLLIPIFNRLMPWAIGKTK